MPDHTLHDMATDLGADVAREFADLYLSALEWRVNRLRGAVAAADTEAVHVAAVSLYSASWMVGAHPLAAAAYAVAEDARSGNVAGVRAGLRVVEARVDGAVADIRLALSELGSVGIPLRAPSR